MPSPSRPPLPRLSEVSTASPSSTSCGSSASASRSMPSLPRWWNGSRRRRRRPRCGESRRIPSASSSRLLWSSVSSWSVDRNRALGQPRDVGGLQQRAAHHERPEALDRAELRARTAAGPAHHHAGDRGRGHHRIDVLGDERGVGEGDPRDQAALEVAVADTLEGRKLGAPRRFVAPGGALVELQRDRARIPARELGARDLGADEVGAVGIAGGLVLIGEDLAVRGVVGLVADGGQERGDAVRRARRLLEARLAGLGALRFAVRRAATSAAGEREDLLGVARSEGAGRLQAHAEGALALGHPFARLELDRLAEGRDVGGRHRVRLRDPALALAVELRRLEDREEPELLVGRPDGHHEDARPPSSSALSKTLPVPL